MSNMMKVVGYTKSLPIEHIDSLQDSELERPVAYGRDLLVQVKAIAVNPVDYKIRQNVTNDDGSFKVIGWDAVGEVIATGEMVKNFKPGDTVYYAGDLTRPGSNAEYQLVDERIVGFKPKSLSNAEAAALPLTTITAWELLFEHLQLTQQSPTEKSRSEEVLLVVGASGGVGSILVQLARTLTGATVIATASRESSQNWVKKLGADYVIDHTKPLQAQLAALDITEITHVASLNSTETYFDTYTELLVPFGRIAIIDDPATPLDIMKMKPKSLSLHIEFMYARSMFQAKDLQAQSELLNRVAELIDQGYIVTTIAEHLDKINARNLKIAHQQLESGTAIGKIVLEGF